jgi:hypothetical protein
MTNWNGRPALGIILARLVELHTRVLRVDAVQRARQTSRLLALATKDRQK